MGANGSVLAQVPAGAGKPALLPLPPLPPYCLEDFAPWESEASEFQTREPGRWASTGGWGPGSDTRVRAWIGQKQSVGLPDPGQGYLETLTILGNVAAGNERREGQKEMTECTPGQAPHPKPCRN